MLQGKRTLIKSSNFQTHFSDWTLEYLLWNCPQINVTGPYWWYANNGSGNCLVPFGIKSLPEPMLTVIYVVTWLHSATMSQQFMPEIPDEYSYGTEWYWASIRRVQIISEWLYSVLSIARVYVLTSGIYGTVEKLKSGHSPQWTTNMLCFIARRMGPLWVGII